MAWTLNSREKMIEAGYVFQRAIACGRCGRQVLLFATPGTAFRSIYIERETYMPHRIACETAASRAKQKTLF